MQGRIELESRDRLILYSVQIINHSSNYKDSQTSNYALAGSCRLKCEYLQYCYE